MRTAFRLAGWTALAAALSTAAIPGEADAKPRRKRAGEAAVSARRAVQLATFEHAWSRIGETYPYEDMKGLDWDAVREELLPRAQAATTPAELRPVLEAMLAKLGESHFGIIPGDAYSKLEALTGSGEAARGDADAGPAADEADAAEDRGSGGDLGLDVRLLEGRVLVTRVEPGSPADLAGVRPGWLLRRVGDVDVSALGRELVASLPDPRAAPLHAHQAFVAALSGSPGSVVRLELEHGGGRTALLDVERRPQPGRPVRLGHLPEMVSDFHSEVLAGDVGYVRFNVFLTPVAEPFGRAVDDFIARDVAGVVVDLRGNPGGIGAMVMGLAGHFLDEPDSLGLMKTRGAELRFVANPRARRFDGPVAVLVDELSASTSEIFAAGLQQLGRARVFGATTPGMALPSVVERLPNGDRLQFAIADLVGPDGERIEGRGVEPDVAAAPTREALLAGRDPALESALTWIRDAADRS